MLDVSNQLTDEDRLIIDKNKSGEIIAAINKIDLPRKWEADALKKLFPRETKFLEISAKLGNGLEELKSTIIDLSVSSKDEYAGSVMITSLRHKLSIEKTLKNIQNAKGSIAQGMSAEFAAFDLREAIDNLDEITGKKINDEILDTIFSSFCIGK
jgi:tRNA modification GTPase